MKDSNNDAEQLWYECPPEVSESLKRYIAYVDAIYAEDPDLARAVFGATSYYLDGGFEDSVREFMRAYAAGVNHDEIIPFVVVSGMECNAVFINISDRKVKVRASTMHVGGGVYFGVSLPGETEVQSMKARKLTLRGKFVALESGEGFSFPLEANKFPVNKLKEKFLRVEVGMNVAGKKIETEAYICFEPNQAD